MSGLNDSDRAAQRGDSYFTEAFYDWFGQSVVRGPDGGPLVCYHITPHDFDRFKPGGLVRTGRNKDGKTYKSGPAIWFAPHPTLTHANHNTYPMDRSIERVGAEKYAAGTNVMPVYLRIEAPFYVEPVSADSEAMRDWRKQHGYPSTSYYITADEVAALQRDGYDGIVQRANDGSVEAYVVFDATQVKSAVGNRGTFERDSANILHGLDGTQRWQRPKRRYSRDFNVEFVPTEVVYRYREYDRAQHGAESKENIAALVEDIRAHGVVEPLMFTYYQGDGTAILGEGNHRLAAAIVAGLTELPVRVVRNTSASTAWSRTYGQRAPIPVPRPPVPRNGYVPADMRPSDLGIESRPMTAEEEALDGKLVEPEGLGDDGLDEAAAGCMAEEDGALGDAGAPVGVVRETVFEWFKDVVRGVWANADFVLPVLEMSDEAPADGALASIGHPHGQLGRAIGNHLLRRASFYRLRVADKLLAMDPETIHKVLIHEACHIGYPNHGREFRDLVTANGGVVSGAAAKSGDTTIACQQKQGARYKTVATFADEKEAHIGCSELQRKLGGKFRLQW